MSIPTLNQDTKGSDFDVNTDTIPRPLSIELWHQYRALDLYIHVYVLDLR